jgi:hypothetical protein
MRTAGLRIHLSQIKPNKQVYFFLTMPVKCVLLMKEENN